MNAYRARGLLPIHALIANGSHAPMNQATHLAPSERGGGARGGRAPDTPSWSAATANTTASRARVFCQVVAAHDRQLALDVGGGYHAVPMGGGSKPVGRAG